MSTSVPTTEWPTNPALRPPHKFPSSKSPKENPTFLRRTYDHKHNLKLIKDPVQLRNILERAEDTLKDRALVEALSDKGEKLRRNVQEIRQRLAEVEADSKPSDQVNGGEERDGGSQVERETGKAADRETESLEEQLGQLSVTSTGSLAKLESSTSATPIISAKEQLIRKMTTTPIETRGKVKSISPTEVIQLEERRRRELELARLKEAKETLENPTRPKFSTKLTPGQFDRVTYRSTLEYDSDDDDSDDDSDAFDFI